MRQRVWIVSICLAVSLLWFVSSEGPIGRPFDPLPEAGAAETVTPAAAAPSKPPALPPLEVGSDAPLLLEDAPPKKLAPGAVDNSACLCCHTNYEHEEMAVVHAEAKVGCVKCHGQSFAHRDDEDNITPPDIMYWPEKIEGACKDCHDTHDAPAKKVIALWQQKCPSKSGPDQLVCTDCHGDHRLKFRTVWWDKKTRKLIVRKEGERIKVRADASPAPGEGGITGEPADDADAMQ